MSSDSLVWFFLHINEQLLLSHCCKGYKLVPTLKIWSYEPSNLFSFNYISLIMLVQLSQFFSPLLLSNQYPHSLRQALHHCLRPWVMCVSSSATPFPVLYFTSPRLFCNYPFVLSPSPLHPSPTTPSHLATITTLSISMILSVLLVCLFCFLDSIIDMYLLPL